MAEALERVTTLTSLNGCDQYTAIRSGGVREMRLNGKELGVWVARFLERSASTLTVLDVRWAASPSERGGCEREERKGGGGEAGASFPSKK